MEIAQLTFSKLSSLPRSAYENIERGKDNWESNFKGRDLLKKKLNKPSVKRVVSKKLKANGK